MINIKRIVAALSIFLSFSVFAVPALVSADTQSDIQCGVNAAAGGSDCAAPANAGGSLDSTITNIINTLSIVVGIIAVIMIIVAGLRYISSAGDTNKVASAKNTLIYAVIGLVVVALAQVIAKFVLNKTTQ